MDALVDDDRPEDYFFIDDRPWLERKCPCFFGSGVKQGGKSVYRALGTVMTRETADEHSRVTDHLDMGEEMVVIEVHCLPADGASDDKDLISAPERLVLRGAKGWAPMVNSVTGRLQLERVKGRDAAAWAMGDSDSDASSSDGEQAALRRESTADKKADSRAAELQQMVMSHNAQANRREPYCHSA